MGDDQPPPPARVPGGTSRCDTGGGAATPPATPAVDTGLGAGPSLDGCAPTPAGQLAPHPAPTKPFDEGKADAAERGMPARLGSAGSAPLDLLPSAVSEMEVAPRPSVRERARRAASAAAYIWWGLPTACKATLLMAVVNFIMSAVYASVAVSLPDVDEEIHITVTIVISAVFVLYTVADAIVYENTLELATSILLDTLVLARVMWFAISGTRNQSFTIALCTAMAVCQAVYVCVAIMAWREFGWRLYGKLGVDYREKGAERRMRRALQRNAYVTLLKINGMLMVVLSAIGVVVSIEKRGGDIHVAVLCISLAGLCVGSTVTFVAARLVLRMRQANLRLLLLFHALMPVALAQPISLICIYNLSNNNESNANVTLNVSGGSYIATLLLLWWGTLFMYRLLHQKTPAAGASATLSTSVFSMTDPVLAAMHAGAWLGKPTQRSPRKLRFFQLSHDGSTLRWGWYKFVRLYYVEEMFHSDSDLTLTLTFPFEAELVLKFPDRATYLAWRRGLAHLLLLIMAPGSPLDPEISRLGSSGSQGVAGWAAVGRTSSKTVWSSAAAEEEASSHSVLQQLGVRVQALGRRVAPRRWATPSVSWSPAARSRALDSGEAAAPGGATEEGKAAPAGGDPAQGQSPSFKEASPKLSSTPPTTTERAQQDQQRRHDASVTQQAKRQRMAAYLQSLAVATHPSIALSSPSAAALPKAARSRLHHRPRPDAASGSVTSRPPSVSVGVQTDESALSDAASSRPSSVAGGGGGWPHWGLTQSTLTMNSSGATAFTAGTDGSIAEQYMLAMQATMVGGDGGGGGVPPWAQPEQQQGPPPPQVQAQQQQQDAATADAANGDADIAASYLAAMAAAAGGAPPGSSGPNPTPQPIPSLAPQSLPLAPDGDGGLAAEYLAAMGAAGAPPAAQQQQQQQLGGQGTPVAALPPAVAQVERQVRRSPQTSPLQQLVWQQQRCLMRQLSHQQLQLPQSPASPLEQLAWQQAASGRGTPLAGTPFASQALLSYAPPGGSLFQLATAVDVIDIEELSLGKMLGSGAEGAVYAAWFLESPVAVKKFERAEDSLHEVEMYLQAGSHDNVVALRGLCQHEGSMYLVLEYCPRGTLDALLHHSAKQPWDPQKLLALVRSIARGMHYLHSRNILHRDLKPANIFVGHGQMMKIGDFGMARILTPSSGEGGAIGPPHLRRLTPGTVGTVQYSAPELLNEDLQPQGVNDGDWALRLDVWSFGVTLWEVLERRRPFEGLSQHAVQAQWVADPYAARLPPVRLPEHLRDRAGKRIFRGLSDLVEDCTRLDPYARPTFRDVLLRLKSLTAFAARSDGLP